ncbi:MAG TPA: hypothetical protein ENJ89_03775, partial [Caldithrix abyssi]|nr:hypothetical protein [Caldithrix abyssi]
MTPQQRFPAAFILFLTITVFVRLLNAGEVYLVIGSDTAIWDGMNVSRFHCTYNPDLYLNPDRNAYRVMEPEFRSGMVDSYGQPMKLTWWMMAGNIFRYATNTNIPVPNIMTLYLMKKYHGDNIRLNGDELTLHYHTFVWTDYDQNGIYFWNQAKSFLESLDDFNVTLAQFLIEEHVFPVSFRSGWHYMDNDWQHYLDERVLPFSMHNDYPAKRTEDPEPIDNIYDWSQAPSAFVPYHPSGANYQIPGDGPGWQVRSAHFWKARVNDYMDSVFIAAQNGGDQVVCFWGHLPENDFLDNLQVMNERAHQCEQKYPGVKFRYCTAIEAMQRWLKNTDAAAPNLQFTDEQDEDELYFHVESDKEIFQQQPFVAVKTIYEEYQVLDCQLVSENHWRTIRPVSRAMVAKAAVTACDSLGNQAMEFIDYLPDDCFIDNGDEGYQELAGNWGTSSAFSWGNDSRVAQLQPEDTALVSWNYRVPRSAAYNVFVQFPDISNRATRFRYRVRLNEQNQDTVAANDEWQPNRWYYLATVQVEQDDRLSVVLSASGQTQPYKLLPADVVRITPLVREKDIDIPSQMI